MAQWRFMARQIYVIQILACSVLSCTHIYILPMRACSMLFCVDSFAVNAIYINIQNAVEITYQRL